MKWTLCNSYDEIPLGTWLGRIDDNNEPYQVINKQEKLITVGGKFYFDARPPIAYTAFKPFRYEWETAGVGEYDTMYRCPKCNRVYSVQAEDNITSMKCKCGFEGTFSWCSWND